MGGQACVFYGAAEFSRDTDLAVLADNTNWRRLNAALDDLKAECIPVPTAELDYLLRGHALHFRCHETEAAGMRVDVMSVMRGVDDFTKLWERRAALTDDDGAVYELLSLPDLVKAKKTQRGKDWPMIQRLVEADYIQNRTRPSESQLRFWLQELRSPESLIKAARAHSELARELLSARPLLELALKGEAEKVADGLAAEEKLEREADRAYWKPLKAELERLRHEKFNRG